MFFVIDGIDGSGKATQVGMLADKLKALNYAVSVFSFPQYGQPSAKMVELYLNNFFGEAVKIDAKLASAFYANDRLSAKPLITKAIRKGQIVLSDRWVSSNMGHQGSKIADPEKRLEFLRWEYDFEYGQIKLPKPTKSIFLHLPCDISYALVLLKSKRSYLESGRQDAHEKDLDHLRNAEQTYEMICRNYPMEWRIVRCARPGAKAGNIAQLESVEEIQNEVRKLVRTPEEIHGEILAIIAEYVTDLKKKFAIGSQKELAAWLR